MDQGIDRSAIRNPRIVAVLAVVLAFGLVMAAQSFEPEPVAVTATDTPGRPAPDAGSSAKAFLNVAYRLVAKWEGVRAENYLDMVGVPIQLPVREGKLMVRVTQDGRGGVTVAITLDDDRTLFSRELVVGEVAEIDFSL